MAGKVNRKPVSPGATAALAFAFVLVLHLAWVGAWLLEQTLEARTNLLGTSGGRFGYWLGMKLLLWVLPACIVIRLSGFTVRGRFNVERPRAVLAWGVGVGIILGVMALFAKTFSGQPVFSSSIGWPLFSGVVVAPFVEELTFRGAVLGALGRRFAFPAANTLTALFFLGIHLPGWCFQGCLWDNLANLTGGALSIFLLGWVFGYVAHRSKSVAASTITHALNNLFNA